MPGHLRSTQLPVLAVLHCLIRCAAASLEPEAIAQFTKSYIQARSLQASCVYPGTCRGVDDTTGCCNTCCGCCDVGCGDVPCWGCGNPKPNCDPGQENCVPDNCSATKPKSDPACVCHKHGLNGANLQCYSCKGEGGCGAMKGACYFCGDQCQQKPTLGCGYDYGKEWHGSDYLLKKVKVTEAEGCCKVCNRTKRCRKWSENGDGLKASDKGKVSKTCTLYSAGAKLRRRKGGVAGQLEG